jgi:hypothetical protein
MIDNVKVGGLVYEVSVVKDLELEEREPDLLGRIDYRDLKIKVDDALAEQMRHQIFIHELTHGILVEAGYTDHEEEQADRIGKVLYQVLKDNDFNFIRKA